MDHEEHIRDCPTCHTMLKMGAGIRLLEHLQDSHRLDDKVALKVVNWVFEKISNVREKVLARVEKNADSTNRAQQ